MSNAASKGLQSALVAERRKRQAAEMEAWVRKSYAAFRGTISKVEEAIMASTKAGFSGGHYKLELLPSGEKFRTLWSGAVGNLYDSPGFFVPIPQLGDEEWDDDEENHFFDNAIEALDEAIEELIQEQRDFLIQGDA